MLELALAGSPLRANNQLGRLNISRLDGDLTGVGGVGPPNGLIDAPTMLGTRSFSIWEQTASGAVLAFDSGSFFEDYLAAFGPSILAVATGFVSILLVAFVYAWKKGVLDWKS